MKDLKHLIRMENLLQQANNELVQEAKNEGRKALGYTCYFMPEVLLDLPGCFSVRLRAPNCTTPVMATYYMSGRTCHYGRSLMERALEGGFNFLDAQMATETCTVTCRFQEHLQRMDIIQNPDFFVEFMDVPFKKTENSLLHYRKQLQAHVLDKLHGAFGIDTSDEALRKAIDQHNEVCRLITEIGSYRKLDIPTITGYEFAVIQLTTLTCPKDKILPMLRETAEELKTRKPDAKPTWKVKLALAGAENDDPDFTKLIESCGAIVVADRYCYGSLPGREEIIVQEGETPLEAIARHYLITSCCPRFMPQDIMRARKKYLADVCREYHADGLIVESNKFCEYWSYERTIDALVIPRDFDIPTCSIEKEYINSASGQLRTRFQAFVESVELKKLHKEPEKEEEPTLKEMVESRIEEKVEKIEDRIDDRLVKIETAISDIDEKKQEVKEAVEEKVEKIENRISDLDEKKQEIKEAIEDHIDDRLVKIETAISDIDEKKQKAKKAIEKKIEERRGAKDE